MNVEVQDDWRRRTRVADPSPELGIHSLSETDRQTDSDSEGKGKAELE